ncbi:MAG: 16S rRNA (uracil(1498)-N(3))-methyltransferase [Acaryochloridaceae cyanobacterium CSU_3_4]|nr:16S rRNA (uracil(1498)-N(3))-methyltransferase [Acaryochloris sp. SU_5_25]NJN37760.1 16S rRNA (uracil(1498)-N(3))-methyltransferase [Acaryochloridaceae cyanobacterium CSU_3_4]
MEKLVGQLQRLAIAPEQFQDQCIGLTAQQHHYLQDVLRLHAGDRFIAMNGQGQLWLAELLATPLQATVIAPLVQDTELALPVMVLAAPPKGNHFDEVVRSCTEMGVSQIVPLMSERTLLKPSDHKLQRWRRIATEAAEQAHRQQIPQILDAIPLSKVLADQDFQKSRLWQKYICTVDASAPHLLHSLNTVSAAGIVVMIGPEGGWTQTELEQAEVAGYQGVSLGRRTLRAVTATCMAVSIAIAHLELQTAQ